MIQDNLAEIHRLDDIALAKRNLTDRLADKIAEFCGNMRFVYLHAFLFTFWLVWNGTGLVPKALHFDPNPFGILTLVVSLEAIFLSTFIMISQNRQEEQSKRHHDIDLQIDLLTEQEVTHALQILLHLHSHLDKSASDEAVALSTPTKISDLIRIPD